jgi:chromate transporter
MQGVFYGIGASVIAIIGRSAVKLVKTTVKQDRLVAGPAGAVVAALGVFLPCYLFVVLPARHFRRFAAKPGIHAFVDGVTAAATGAIAGAGFVLGRRAITDIPTALIALVTLGVLVQKKIKIPEPLVIVASGVVGLLLKGALGT